MLIELELDSSDSLKLLCVDMFIPFHTIIQPHHWLWVQASPLSGTVLYISVPHTFITLGYTFCDLYSLNSSADSLQPCCLYLAKPCITTFQVGVEPRCRGSAEKKTWNQSKKGRNQNQLCFGKRGKKPSFPCNVLSCFQPTGSSYFQTVWKDFWSWLTLLPVVWRFVLESYRKTKNTINEYEWVSFQNGTKCLSVRQNYVINLFPI